MGHACPRCKAWSSAQTVEQIGLRPAIRCTTCGLTWLTEGAGFVCPRCAHATLEVVESVELGGTGPHDYEHSINRIRCAACGLTGASEYREYGGTFTGPEYEHDGFLLDAADEDALRLWFSSEPRAPIEGVRVLVQPVSSFSMQSIWEYEQAKRWPR